MSKKTKVPKYALTYTFRIWRSDDATPLLDGVRCFRSNSVKELLKEFKRRVRKEKLQGT